MISSVISSESSCWWSCPWAVLLGLWGYTEHTKQVVYRANKGIPITLLQPLFIQLLHLHFSECYDYINILKRMVFVLVWPFSAYPVSKSTFVWQPVVVECLLCPGFNCCEHGKGLDIGALLSFKPFL